MGQAHESGLQRRAGRSDLRGAFSARWSTSRADAYLMHGTTWREDKRIDITRGGPDVTDVSCGTPSFLHRPERVWLHLLDHAQRAVPSQSARAALG